MTEVESNHLLIEMNMLMLEWMWIKLADKKSDLKESRSGLLSIHNQQ